MAVHHCDVLILGAGAAGLYCAIAAGRRGRAVMVLDHAAKIGKKILISGGGRCNFTNRHATHEQYLSRNPDFCRSALARHTPAHFIELVERHRIPYHEKKLGQLFCDGSAKEIVAMLVHECEQAKVQIRAGVTIESVATDGRFRTRTSAGDIVSERVVVACGGLSIPSIGASDLGYRLARQFSLAVVPTDPALVPLTLGGGDLAADLSGVSLEVVASVAKARFADGMVFTHHGLSGPAVLQASSYWQHGQSIEIDFAPGAAIAEALAAARASTSKKSTATLLGEFLPRSLVQRFLAPALGGIPAANLSPTQIQEIAAAFHAWRIVPTGTEGYRKAEVTRGGVDTRELSSQTMEARKVPGLHFIGEVVDVTGWLGGYNFQWAWASGHACGAAV